MPTKEELKAEIETQKARWDYNNPEFAVTGTILHGFEFFFFGNIIMDISLEKMIVEQYGAVI